MPVNIFVFLHVLALHTSIAAMELLAWLIVLCALIFSIKKKPVLRGQTWLWAYVGLTVAAAVSLLVNPPLKPFWIQFGFMRFGFIVLGLFLVLKLIWSAKFEKWLIRIWLGALGLAGLLGVIQCLTGFDEIRRLTEAGGVWRGQGFFSLSLTYAYVMGISVFALSTRTLKEKPVWFARAMLALGVLGIIASLSRGAWLAMLVCAFFYLLMEKRRWLFPFTAVAAVSIVALAFVAPGFQQKISGLVHLQLDHSSEMRLHLWWAYIDMFLEHPLFGAGLFQGDKLLPGYYEKLGIVEPFVSHAHNNYLVFLAGTGLVGFVSYMALIGIFLVKTWQKRRRNAWAWGLLLAQIFLHLGGLTEANFIDGEVNHMLVFVWAMVLTLEFHDKKGKVK